MGSSFELLGQHIDYPEAFDHFAGMLGTYVNSATEACNAFLEMYRANKNLNEVIAGMQNRAAALTNEMVQHAINALGTAGVQMTQQDFIQKYSFQYQFDYNTLIAPTLNAQSQIMGEFNQRLMMKGMPANSQLDGMARSNLTALYKDERTCFLLTDGIRNTILNIYPALIAALQENEKLDSSVTVSREKAAQLYSASFSGYNPDAPQIVQAIFAFPGEKQYYDSIFWQLTAEEGDAFERFLGYFGLSMFYPGLGQQRQAAKEFDKKLSESPLASFDYYDTSAENYAFLRTTLSELAMADTITYPELSVYAGYIKNYYSNACINDQLFSSPQYVNFIKRDAGLEDFVKQIRTERDALPINPYKSLWLYGDMAGDKLPLSPKQSQLQAVAYEGDSIIMNCPQGLMGNKGIAVTSRYIVDFAKNIRISLSNVVDIVYNGDTSIRIMDQMCYIEMSKLSAPYINPKLLPNPQMKDTLIRSLTFGFLNLLKLYCIRYGGNQFLIQNNPYLA